MYHPRNNEEIFAKNAIDINPPCVPTKGSSAVHPTEKVEVTIDYSDSLFDPNEKDPATRALNMVKEYCRVSLKDLQGRILEPQNRINQQRAYADVIDFIEDHQSELPPTKSGGFH